MQQGVGQNKYFLFRCKAPEDKWSRPAQMGRETQNIALSILHLRPGQDADVEIASDREAVCILIRGEIYIVVGGEEKNFVRRSVFENEPGGVFLHPGVSAHFRAAENGPGAVVVVAECRAIGSELTGHSWVTGSSTTVERGRASYSRWVRNIIDGDFPAHSILCGETISPAGHWSSFPPHKYDEVSAEESSHEEVYFYAFDPPGGWGYQELYDPANGSSQVVRVQDGDVVNIPRGYHPVVTAPGYRMYYFWILAGPERELRFRADPRHSWVDSDATLPNRAIRSSAPGDQAKHTLDILGRNEAAGMRGQPPVVWSSARGHRVFDPDGNIYLDFTSGVLVANAGHAHPRVQNAIHREVERGLLTSYVFATEIKAQLTEELLKVSPPSMNRVAFFCSGSEAVECCLKLALTLARRKKKRGSVTVSFTDAFHGRTMGSQISGGLPDQKKWLEDVINPGAFAQVPFPDERDAHDHQFTDFENRLSVRGILPTDVAGVVIESYQGGTVKFASVNFMRALRAWCTQHDVSLILDEVQSGFGRTGTWWGFEHYGITPDLIACGKGLTSSLPLSAVIGTGALLDQFPPGAMSTTHGGNPLSCAAAVANIQALREEGLPNRARLMERIVREELSALTIGSDQVVVSIRGRGLVFGIQVGGAGTVVAAARARKIVDEVVRRGVLLFAPVGPVGATIKINPPLMIPEAALREGLRVIVDVIKMISDECWSVEK